MLLRFLVIRINKQINNKTSKHTPSSKNEVNATVFVSRVVAKPRAARTTDDEIEPRSKASATALSIVSSGWAGAGSSVDFACCVKADKSNGNDGAADVVNLVKRVAASGMRRCRSAEDVSHAKSLLIRVLRSGAMSSCNFAGREKSE